MSENSPLLDLPYLQPAQAQKHVTHNEALRMLDASVQLSVPGPGESAPPADPQEGQRLLVGSGATGDWEGQDNAVAVFTDGAWQFFVPAVGWTAWLREAGTWAAFDGSGWEEMAPGRWGVNASADAQTRLAVAAEGTLFTHDGADHRLRINKAAPGNTASLLFQTGYSGRAEMGLAGDDGFAVKLSADGATWRTALAFDPATARVSGDAVQRDAADATPGRLMLAEHGLLRGDVVGTVSQTGGTATGAVIESVDGAGGRAVKWADGTMMMTRRVTFDMNESAAQSFAYPQLPASVLAGAVAGADAAEAGDATKRQALADLALWTDAGAWVLQLPQPAGPGTVTLNLSVTGLWY